MKNLTIAARLLEERTRLKFNQRDFAALGGVGKNTQIAYEKGDSHPDAAFLAAIAAQGADVLYIVTGKRDADAAASLSEDESRLLSRFRQGSAVLRGYLQEVGTGGPGQGNTVTIGGDVGQSVAGDQHNAGAVSFKVGGKK